MDREAFERLRDDLDSIIAPVKFRLAEEVYSHASFGSMYAVWSRRGESIRLVWDGKEAMLVLQTRTDTDWSDLAYGPSSEAEVILAAARQHVS
ncbi:MAG: hypothetical protein ACRDGE_02965 [Candidatus Limnocylindria bacterium]